MQRLFSKKGLVLLQLILLTASFILVHHALPRLLSQVYGSVSVQLYRPTWPILVTSASIILFGDIEKTHLSADALICWTGLCLALFPRFHGQYLKYDVRIVSVILFKLDSLLGWKSVVARGHDLDLWTPVIASTIIEVVVQALLMLALANIFLEGTASTKSNRVRDMLLLLTLGIGGNAILSYSEVGALHQLYWTFPLLLVTILLRLKSRNVLVICCFVVVITLGSSIWPELNNTIFSISQTPSTFGSFTLRASSSSVTGQITVLENEKYRLLRADHSLLGGEWLGEGQGQSIFTAFYMQSLAIYALPRVNTDLKILQIGLGIGTATRSILQSSHVRNLALDVVEIDSKVIDYAHEYFSLPRPTEDVRLRIFREDASKFIDRQTDRHDSYDLISHDVFTGGSLTFSLFTVEFFGRVKQRLTPGGILTVNYVYSQTLGRQNFEAVTSTLQSVFSQVDAFLETGKLNEVNNIVIYCSDEPIVLDIPSPLEGEVARTNFEQTASMMESWRFPGFSDIVYSPASVLHDESVDMGASRARIAKADSLMAMAHWKFMRQLLKPPEDEIWRTVM